VKKLSTYLNGVSLLAYRVGDVVDCADATARMLLLEGWAERLEHDGPLVNEEPPASIREIIEHHRESHKARL
jgi:hypothetical protein